MTFTQSKCLIQAALAGALLCCGPALAQRADPLPGQWGQKAPLLEPNSEFTLASSEKRFMCWVATRTVASVSRPCRSMT